jgi:predicted O-methyltransferase YrrM
VPPELRANWRLFTDGDRKNLPRILAESGPIDLFHYDSDKSYRGRNWALSQILPHLSENGLIIMDDIQDNMQFADFVRARTCHHFLVESEGKYVGVAFFAGNDWLRPFASA